MSASFLRHLALCQICAATTATAFGAGMLWLATGHVPLPVRLIELVLQ